MSNADRIGELRAKYEENPRRYFAPLANEYRKAGDLAQAIAICREHLPKQPGHMSGYIVFGQTLFEASNLDEARSVFEQALTLDPENLIALKHLGDIARLNGENGVARRWYARVLDADPRNDDIASQLASLGSPTPIAPMPVVPPPAPYSEPPLAEAVGVFATFDPSRLLDVPDDVIGMGGGNEFWSPLKAQPPVHHEPLDLDFPENPEPAAAPDFEEGILAPEWPDTAELVSRIVTPLRSATPVSVPVTLETVEAFGREASDEAEDHRIDLTPDDELVEAFLPPERGSQSGIDAAEVASADAGSADVASDSAGTVDASSAGSDSKHTGSDESSESADASPEPFSEPLSVAAEAGDTLERSAPSDSVEAASLEPAASEPTPVAPVLGVSASEALEDASAGLVEWSEPESVPPGDFEDFAFASELPWVPDAPAEPSLSFADVTVDGVDSDKSADEGVEDDLGDTAEFPVPTQFAGAHHAALSSNATGEFASDETAVADLSDAAEESFADISSELQNERDESDRQASDSQASDSHANDGQTSEREEIPDSEPAQPFVTETMAELLVSQGFHSRAIEVYDELVRRRPHDPVLVSRLAELRDFEAVGGKRQEINASTPTPRFSTPIYNTPLSGTPLFSTPVSATPVNAPALGDSGATGSNLSERHSADRLSAFRTARERFAELARRRVARRTPTHATAISDDASEGLSTLFGTATPATTDELAARALADAFGPVQDSGESLFDPAPTATPAMPMRSLTPRQTSSIPSAHSVEGYGDRQPSADYSFDKFFPDPAMSAREVPSSPTTVAPTPSSAQPVNEDLAQFSAWLKGLNHA